MADHGHFHGNRPGADDDTLDIRIASVFVVLVSGMIGGIPPLYLKIFKDLSNPIARMLRAAAAGIVLSLGFVHVLPHGVEEYGILAVHAQLDPYYNPAGAATIFGIFLMMVIEGIAHGQHSHSSGKSTENGPLPDGGAENDSDGELKKKEASLAMPVADIEQQDKTLDQHPHAHNSHGPGTICLHSHGTVGGIGDYGTQRQKTLAHMFELGCIVHSVIIGIMLGVIDRDFPQARNILIALCFHQWLEGIGLGALISIADFGLLKGWILVILYSVTAPVGIAIGIGIAEGYDPDSTRANAVQGTLNCVSAGILIYMGLCQMVAVDFAPESMAMLKSRWAVAGCYIAFFVACGCMSFLAIWA